MPHSEAFYLNQALALAQIRRGFCAPNPPVGVVIVRDKEILATGYHFSAGNPHAEIEALKKIKNAKGATVYITLEPCCHFGRTPPCTDALIAAGVKAVVYAYRDPNPLVAGNSEKILRDAGILCDYLPLPEIAQFYSSYQHWHDTQRPYVTAKIALTLDGKIAGPNGEPIKITGEELQEFTHFNRKISDAILTTVKTIIKDDPQLNARFQNEIIAKPIYILDSRLELPVTAKIFSTAKSLTIFHAKTAPKKNQKKLIEMGARCIPIDTKKGLLNLTQIVQFIGLDGIQDLWIEAGGTCFSSFAEAKLLQRAFIYFAPRIIVNGQPAFQHELDLQPQEMHSHQMGEDILCELLW